LTKIILFGDTNGIPQLIKHIPIDNVVAIIGASIRPQYNHELRSLSTELGVSFIVQPKWRSFEYDSFVKTVKQLNADLIWIHSYSMIIRSDVLNLVQYGGINLHGALLPKNRGCNPIQWAILKNDFETGVTLHEVSDQIDAGPIIDQRKISINFRDSWLDLNSRIAEETDKLISSNLHEIISGNWNSTPQHDNEANFGRRRKPSDGEFEWSEPVIDIFNKIRALLPPLPPAYYKDSKNQKIEITSFKAIASVTAMKCKEIGGNGFVAGNFKIRVLSEFDYEVSNSSNLSNFLNLPSGKPINEFSELIVFVIDNQCEIKFSTKGVFYNLNPKKQTAELSLIASEKESVSVIKDFLIFLFNYFFEELNFKEVLIYLNLKKEIPLNFIEESGLKLTRNPTNSNSFFIKKSQSI
jgi:UDP-4-amino-4-deoxy-L-arabinose formyltransferase/UDP-glucuronic acid dehydrogenase (UDP-4-keto-hexauronic acid decarboxylating)